MRPGSPVRLLPEEAVHSFVDLILKLQGYLTIVQHDDVVTIFDQVRERFPRLSLSDAVHLATAIKCRCCVFKTSDHDFHGIGSVIKRFVEEKFSINYFGVLEVKKRE